MRRIQGRTAFITGAASGIGRALALRLAAEGARLCLLDVDEPRLAAVVAECQRQGVETLGHPCDVSRPDENAAAVQYALKRFGAVDILVNNAGITYYGQTSRMSVENWDRLLAVNLHAPIQFTRELLPTLLARDEAHIVNVASICGLVGLSRVAAYTTTKFALVGFTESLRAELGRQSVGVTALCPGFVDTNLFASAPRGADLSREKTPPRWLMTTPERIAHRAVRAIYRDEGVVVVQPYARLLYYVKRWAPGLMNAANRIRRRRQTEASSGSPESAPRRAA